MVNMPDCLCVLLKYLTDLTILKDETLNIMIAGRDTVRQLRRFYIMWHLTKSPPSQTAATLTFVVYLLAQHPEVQEKLREELNTARKDGELSYDDLVNLPYLDAVCRETLRLYVHSSHSVRH